MSQPFVTLQQLRAQMPQHAAVPDLVFIDAIQETHSQIEIELGHSYEGGVQTAVLDGRADPELELPLPGARQIVSVFENGIELDTDEFLLDPQSGRFLTRLSTSPYTRRDWLTGYRNVTVRYYQPRAPRALVKVERVESERAILGALSGYTDTIGVEGQNTVPYSHALTAASLRIIKALKRGGGVGIW